MSSANPPPDTPHPNSSLSDDVPIPDRFDGPAAASTSATSPIPQQDPKLITTTQIPIEGFNSPLTTVEALKQENTELRFRMHGLLSKLATTSRDIRILSALDYGNFYLFPELPPELQLMIWTFASAVPRIVAVRPRRAPFWESRRDEGILRCWRLLSLKSKQPATRGVCVSARNAAAKRQKNIYKPSGFLPPAPSDLVFPKIFINPKVDIVWFMADELLRGRFTYFYEYKYVLKSLHPQRISKCAFTWDTWELEAIAPLMMYGGFMDGLAHLGVQEIFVIVGEIPKVHNNLAFVQPGDGHDTKLRTHLKSLVGFLSNGRAQEPIEYSWRNMKVITEQYLRHRQSVRFNLRQRVVPIGGLSTGEDIDRHFPDPANWPVSGVKFVELR